MSQRDHEQALVTEFVRFFGVATGRIALAVLASKAQDGDLAAMASMNAQIGPIIAAVDAIRVDSADSKPPPKVGDRIRVTRLKDPREAPHNGRGLEPYMGGYPASHYRYRVGDVGVIHDFNQAWPNGQQDARVRLDRGPVVFIPVDVLEVV